MTCQLLFPTLALIMCYTDSQLLAGGATTGPVEQSAEHEGPEWEYSVSASTYFSSHSQDYVNPVLTADRDWLHLEARYNYEALKTGSIWLGYNWSIGDKLVLEITPMIGGVFGNVTGVAPGYTVSINYGPLEFFTQGEYLFDAGASSENFFYNWSELSCAATSWFRFGFVLDRTKLLGTDIAVRRGPLIGFTYKKVDFTTYWLSPGSSDSTFVFAVALNF
jgi:hypothetical protein